MNEYQLLINEFSDFNFSKDELKLIISGYTKKTVKKGDFILSPDKVANHYYLVESGFYRSFVIDVNGNEVSTNFYKKEDMILDETSFFMRVNSKEYLQVVEDGVLWCKDFNTFQEHFNLSEKYRDWGRAHLAKNFFEFKKRTLSMITESAKDRYLNLLENSPEIIKKASLKHIASFLGVTDSSLSRIRKEIVK